MSIADYETDVLIQESIRSLDAQILTIAHRLASVIDYDKILVLDGGEPPGLYVTVVPLG